MPQHVGMREEREFRSHARPGNHALIMHAKHFLIAADAT
jgi:hypothetical protein